MPVLVVPNVFVNGTIADATLVDANFNAVSTIVNGLDWVNVGANGFFASQIIPTTVAQAAFGGNFGYTFNPNNAAQVPLTLQAVTGQSVDIFDVFLAGVKDVWIDNVAAMHILTALTFGVVGSAATNIAVIAGGAVDIATGCHYNGTTYVADAVSALVMRFQGGVASPLTIFTGTGLTVGVTFTPVAACSIDQVGNVTVGSTTNPSSLKFGNNPQGQTIMGGGGLYTTAGAHFNFQTSQWVADQTTACIMGIASNGAMQIFYNTGLTVGANFTPAQFLLANCSTQIMTWTGAIVASLGLYAGNNGLAGASGAIWNGNGGPPVGLGVNGDYYFRKDATGPGAHIYFKAAGAWAGLTGATI